MENDNSKKLELINELNNVNVQNIDTEKLISINTKLSELDPEIAREVLAQFPELAKLLSTTLTEYCSVLKDVIASDDASIQAVYSLHDKELDEASKSRKEFYDMVEKVQADCSKALDAENLSPEERNQILERELDMLRMANEKDNTIRDHEQKVLDSANKKDSEKRAWNWKAIVGASAAAALVVGFASAFLGGGTDINLPDKH